MREPPFLLKFMTNEFLGPIYVLIIGKLCKVSTRLDPYKKFIYSEKATKFCEIFIYVVPVKSKVKISQNYVAFSEYMNCAM